MIDKKYFTMDRAMEKKYNVIVYNFNSEEFESYNIIPYLLNCYNEVENKPKTFKEFKDFIKDNSMHKWWSRCEYEIILSPWPYLSSPSERYNKKGEDDIEAWKKHWEEHLNQCKKIDVHKQVMMNLNIITQIFIECIKNEQGL